MSKAATKGFFDLERAWRQTKKAMDKMTDAERRQSLIDAGILTRTGRVAKPYAGIFKPLPK